MSARQQTPPPKTPDLPRAQVEQMSPAERDAYFDRKAREGVDPDSWLFGPIKQWMNQVKGDAESKQIRDQNIKDSTSGRDVQYVQGLQPSNADYKGVDHTQLKQYLDTNLDVDQVTSVSDAYHAMHQVFDRFATSMNQAVNSSKGTWEGGAADSAQAYFTSLGKWSEANGQNAKLASETTYEQGQAASTAKNSMPEPIKFSWGDEFKSWATSNPFNLADNVDKSIQKQKDSQAAHEQAAGVMSTYDNNLYAAASKQPAFVPPPAFTPSGTGDKNGSGDDNGGSDSHRPNITMPGGNQQGFSGNSGFSGNTGTSGLPGSAPTISGPGQMTGSGTVPSGGLAPSSFTPGNVPPPSTNPNANPSMGMGPMPMTGMGPMGGMGGDSEYGGRSGRGGGGGGFGPGSGNTTGAGSASGAARPGGIGAAEAAAGRGMGGLGSGSGAGRGGMGAGGMGRGQGAQGEEDTEHQRPTYLVEGDPDEVFGTDMRTAPPVIGE